MNLRKNISRLGATLGIVGALAAWAVTQVTAEQSKTTALPNDPLQFIGNTPTAPAGTLLYVASVRVQNQRIRQRYLVLHQTVTRANAPQRAVYHVTIPENIPDIIFASEFLPDNQTILFKAGWPYDDPGHYRFYLWNVATNQLELSPSEQLFYRRLFPSCTGKLIAYYQGGNADGDDYGGNRTSPLTLFIFDREAGKSKRIVQNPAAKFAAWTARDTLLYSVIDEDSWAKDVQHQPSSTSQTPQRQVESLTAARPDIYEISSAGENPTLLLQDGYKPSPSPDNQRIAFFTSTDPAQPVKPSNAFDLNFPRQSYLCLYDRTTKNRSIIQPVTKIFPQLAWNSDSQYLITLEETYQDAKGKAQISVIDTLSNAKKPLAVLTATDFEPTSRASIEPQFQMLNVSSDGKKVFIKVSEFVAQGQVFADEKKTLRCVDLQTGKVSVVAEVLNQQANSLGMDWYPGVFGNGAVVKNK